MSSGLSIQHPKRKRQYLVGGSHGSGTITLTDPDEVASFFLNETVLTEALAFLREMRSVTNG